MRPLLVTLLVVLLSSGPAHAFCRSTTCNTSEENCLVDEIGCKQKGTPLWWRSSCVGISLNNRITANLDQTEVSAALDRALARWSNLSCGDKQIASFAYGRQGTVRCGVGQDKNGPNANVLYFRDDGWPYDGLYDTLGYTTVHFRVSTGEILGADIEINTAKNYITVGDGDVQNDFESIITHELGHTLGLSHSHDPDASMRPSYSLGTTSMRHLNADDIDGACAVYPPEREATCDLTPYGGFTDCRETAPADEGCQLRPGPAAGSLSPFLAVVLSTLARLHRQRRRALRVRPAARLPG